MSSGTLVGIHLAARHGGPMEERRQVEAVTGKGLLGDRNFGRTRQVTLVAVGELEEAAAELGYPIAPGATRRNLTVDVERLPRATGTRIAIGEVVLEVWRDAAPCEVMESSVGRGARAALAGRAGVSATVLSGGMLSLGDPVRVLSPA